MIAASLAIATTARPADTATLKDAYQDHFYVGVAINRAVALGTSVRADNVNRSAGQLEKDIALVKEQFDQISPENDLKWALIHPQPGADGYDFGPADAYVNFGLSNHMYIVGHTLVWHGQTPRWVFQGTNLPPGVTNTPARLAAETTDSPGTNAPGRRRFGRGFGGGFGGFGGALTGPRASRDELLERMRDHIHTVVGRYRGKVKVWDVVNEAIADGGTNILRNSPWLQIIGPDFIAKAFEYAHEADPDAILRYNDYSLENPAKRHKLITLIKSLQAQHVPVMAIGSQTHVSVSSPSFEAEDQALTELEQLGLPIHITEFDVNGAQGGQRNFGADVAENDQVTQGGLVADAGQRLANQYSNLFKVFLKHQNSVKLVTLWGVNDSVSWRANGRPLLFDGSDKPKPAFYAALSAAAGEPPSDWRNELAQNVARLPLGKQFPMDKEIGHKGRDVKSGEVCSIVAGMFQTPASARGVIVLLDSRGRPVDSAYVPGMVDAFVITGRNGSAVHLAARVIQSYGTGTMVSRFEVFSPIGGRLVRTLNVLGDEKESRPLRDVAASLSVVAGDQKASALTIDLLRVDQRYSATANLVNNGAGDTNRLTYAFDDQKQRFVQDPAPR